MGKRYFCIGPVGFPGNRSWNRNSHLVEEKRFMKFKGTAWMLVVFLILGIYYFLVDLPAEKKKAHEKEIAGKVFYFKPADVMEFSLIKADQTITLQQTPESTWRLIRPLKTQGDNPESESFLTEIENLEKSRVVENNPKDLDQYGLKTPAVKIHFKFKDGKEETLLFGHESPMGGKIYLKLEGDAKVLLAAASKAKLEKSVYDFRDKTILNFSSGSINQIQIKRKKNPLHLIRKKEEWLVSGEVKAKADKDSVQAFLRAIQFSRIKEFESENPDSLEPYGLNHPIKTLVLEEENKKTYSIDLGNIKPGSGTFAKKEGEPGVFLVDAKFLGALDKKNVDFLNKTLVEFEEKEVTGIKIQTEKETIHAIREDKDNWKIKKPLKTEADMATVRSLLFDLKEAKLSEFIKLSLDAPDSFGLDKPKRSFSLIRSNGKSISIHFGNSTIDDKEVFAQRTGESTVFSISKETTKKLFRTFHELRNKKLFNFKTDDANQIVIKTSKTLFELQKSGSNWNLVKPEEIEIKEFLAKDLLWTMKGMEFESVFESGAPPESTGLTPPAYTVRIWNDEQKMAELMVGNVDPASKQYYAQIGEENGYYRIKKKYLDSIPLDLNSFKVQ
ncbi:MAG: DUF4340 domain-containing protein [Nitrospinae bacterium]|nr:DUF4340 domain-containing protein [Nitrospinota bacterium]